MTRSHAVSWVATGLGAARERIRETCRDCPMLKTPFQQALRGRSTACPMIHGRYRQGQVLFQQGNPATRIYAVKSGLLKTYKTEPGGRHQLMDLLGPGDVLALEAVRAEEYCVGAEALADSEACFMERARLLELVGQSVPLALEVIRSLSQSVMDCRSRMLDLGTKTAKARLASFFMRLIPPDLAEATSADIHIPISRSEIADLIGVTPETISRLLQHLTARRIIAASGKRLRVLDVIRLQASAR